MFLRVNLNREKQEKQNDLRLNLDSSVTLCLLQGFLKNYPNKYWTDGSGLRYSLFREKQTVASSTKHQLTFCSVNCPWINSMGESKFCIGLGRRTWEGKGGEDRRESYQGWALVFIQVPYPSQDPSSLTEL